MTGRRLLIIIGSAVGLLLVLAAAAALLLPAERIGRLAASHAEEVLDREVAIERVRLRLLPRPAVALEGVTVSRFARPAAGAEGTDSAPAAASQRPDSPEAQDDPDGTDEAPAGSTSGQADWEDLLASVDRVELRPRLLPLLRRHVIVDDVVVERPYLLLEIDEGGKLNLPSLEGGAEAGDGNAEIRIRRLSVREGRVGYRDANTGSLVRLDGINQTLRLSGTIAAGELSRVALGGHLTIDAIHADLPEVLAFPLRDLTLRVEHELELDQEADRLDLERVRVALQEIPIDVAGTVQAVSDPEARELALRAGAEDFDVARLIASLPAGFLESLGEDFDPEALRGTAGRAGLDARITGRAGGGAVPEVAGTLSLDDLQIAYTPVAGRGGADLIAGLTGRIAFSLDSLATEGVSGRLLGEPFRLAFNVHDLADPRGRGRVEGGLDLAEASRQGLLPEGTRGSGRVALDVSGSGVALQPETVLLTGNVTLAGVQLETPALQRPLVVQSGQVELRGQEVAAQGLQATMGESDVTLDFQARQWLGFAMGDSTRIPEVVMDARSTFFDVDDAFGIEPRPVTYGQLFFAHLGDREIDGRSAPEIAEELELTLPEIPNIRLDGRIRADRVIRDSLTYEDVDVTLSARDRNLEVSPARFRLMGGSMQVTARLGASSAGAADGGGGAPAGTVRPLTVEYAVNDVNADDFLARYTLFDGRIGGSMLLAGYAAMNLEENMLPVRESVGSEGTSAVLNGELLNWPLARELGERLSVGGFDTLAFRDWSGRFRIAGARILLEETMMEAGDLAVQAAGSFDVAGNLEMGATFYLPEEWVAEIPGAPPGLLAAVSGSEGRIPVGANIGGTVTRPSLSLDLSEAGAAAANQAREAAEAEAREQAERLAEELGIQLPGRDTLSSGADSIRSRVEENVRSRLRRIIPGGGG